eukprot:282224-Hanusia_phi.AAC.1
MGGPGAHMWNYSCTFPIAWKPCRRSSQGLAGGAGRDLYVREGVRHACDGQKRRPGDKFPGAHLVHLDRASRR